MDEYRIRKTEEEKEQEKMKTKYCISPFTRRELVIILKKRTEKRNDLFEILDEWRENSIDKGSSKKKCFMNESS